MQITRLSVKNVRVHDEKTIEFVNNPTLISGPNGSGKTSLIEAIYIALRGKSFRGGDEAICRNGADQYRISLESSKFTYHVQYDQVGDRKTRQFIVDDKKYTRLPHQLKHPIVLFEPDDLRIISGSPQRRRRFIDTLIQQYDPVYSQQLSRYERALQQRNKLLKTPQIVPDILFPWNILLSEYGAIITMKRQAAVGVLNDNITDTYRKIARNNDKISIQYSHSSPVNTQKLLRQLELTTAKDISTGVTNVGPHRHDLQFEFNGQPAAKVASRGESRTIILALKFIEAEHIKAQCSIEPLILLDDVFGELDDSRQRALDGFRDNQVIMTSVSPSSVFSE